LDLYLKSQQQNDIQNCIDTAIREDPRQVCKDFMESSNVFRLWEKSKQAAVCMEAAVQVHQKCEQNSNCNPSAVFMANLYTTFVEFINDSYGSLYKTFDQELNRDLEEESQKINNSVSVEEAKDALLETKIPETSLRPAAPKPAPQAAAIETKTVSFGIDETMTPADFV